MRTASDSSTGTLMRAALLVGLLVLLPCTALAQSSIAGLVSDLTGGVLPGVTVEAASPALIEGVRSATTDGQGRYAIVELRPGTYTVTFTLPGFRVVVRDGIRVTTGAAVPVNAQLQVGALEETVTVTGESSVVDVQQASRRQVLDREVLDAVPSNRTLNSAGMILPGLRMDGRQMTGGLGNTTTQRYLVARGKDRGQNSSLVDGIDTRMLRETGELSYNNFGAAQEVAIETNPTSADTSGGGIKINMIPREGGNMWNGDVHLSGLDGSWQANNIDDGLREAGLRTPAGTEWAYDLNPSVGGPIVRDKLWLFTSGRLNRGKLAPAGATFFEPNPVTGELEPGTRQGFNDTRIDNFSIRLTWQAAPKHKISTYRDQWWRYQSAIGATALDDWATVPGDYRPGFQFIWPTKYTYTASNRLLIEGGYARYTHHPTLFNPPEGVLQEPFTPAWYANTSRLDRDTGYETVAGGNHCCWDTFTPSNVYTASATYVTGSHTFKTGVQGRWGFREASTQANNGALQRRYQNGLPQSVSVAGRPDFSRQDINRDVGFYAQDRWTIDRLTLNAGIRVESHKSGIAGTSTPAGRFVPARTIDGFNVFDFTDVLPRFSVVYDLFGDARTALKFSAGRFVETRGWVELNSLYNPISSASEVRNWFDCDLIPGSSTCSGQMLPTNGDDIAQDNEIPPSTNPQFGFRGTLQPNPELERPASWDYSVSVQQEVASGVSVAAAWYHTYEDNTWGRQDRSITPDDFTPFLIPNPLGNGEMITVYNLNPGVATGDVVMVSSDINKRTYNGFEVSGQARLPNGGLILGGWYADRKLSVLCDSNSPNDLRYCDQTGNLQQELGAVPALPFLHEFKFVIAHPLPWDFEGSLSFISYPGNGADGNVTWQNITYAVPAGLFPPPGRTVPVTVQLAAPGTNHLERWNQLDVSFKRVFRVGNLEFRPSVDVYNLTNNNTVLAEVEAYPAHGRPISVHPGRLLRLGVLMRF